MKKAKLTLTLNKETVANLNSNEMNDIKGGTEKATPNCPTMCTNCCPVPETRSCPSYLNCGTRITCI